MFLTLLQLQYKFNSNHCGVPLWAGVKGKTVRNRRSPATVTATFKANQVTGKIDREGALKGLTPKPGNLP